MTASALVALSCVLLLVGAALVAVTPPGSYRAGTAGVLLMVVSCGLAAAARERREKQ